MASVLVAKQSVGGTNNSNKHLSTGNNGTSQQKQLICIKFVPQAFNPNKCQQCFNYKELHSAEALAEFSKVIIFLS
jgi:hypothetical protein